MRTTGHPPPPSGSDASSSSIQPMTININIGMGNRGAVHHSSTPQRGARSLSAEPRVDPSLCYPTRPDGLFFFPQSQSPTVGVWPLKEQFEAQRRKRAELRERVARGAAELREKQALANERERQLGELVRAVAERAMQASAAQAAVDARRRDMEGREEACQQAALQGDVEAHQRVLEELLRCHTEEV
eukprot:Sspe_Gene.61443::Locus_34103_Transcript_1_1_Confidence_1.000_Length_620::g.61443::m.61443